MDEPLDEVKRWQRIAQRIDDDFDTVRENLERERDEALAEVEQCRRLLREHMENEGRLANELLEARTVRERLRQLVKNCERDGVNMVPVDILSAIA